MVRVPNTLSSVLLGARLSNPNPQPDLHAMSADEVDRFIRKCVSALRSHERDFTAGNDKEAALSAFESSMALLLELRDIYPVKRAHIDAILLRLGYTVPEK